MSEINKVIDVINKVCPFTNINENTELIDSGIITSLTLFELVIELEIEFNLRITEDLIVWENFVTPLKICETMIGENS